MSDARAMQERFDALSAQFLRPLLEGGAVVVGRPLSPGMLEHFAHGRPSDDATDRAVYRALHAAASDIAPVRVLPWPDRGLAAVIMACHDLLAATDPALDRLFARKGRAQILGWVDYFTDRAGPPLTRGAALARHAVVSRALALRRRDVTVKNWAYTYRFFGRPVPKNVVALPRLRMVRQEQAERDLVDIVSQLDADLHTRERLRALVSRSPVTELTSTDRFPDLRFGKASLAVLSDDAVRNGVAGVLAQQGDRIAAPLGRAIRELAATDAPPALLYYALALALEVHVIAVLDARGDAPAPYGAPSDDDARLFAAVLPAMLGAPDDLAPLLELDPRDLARLRRRAPALEQASGKEISGTVIALIDRARPPAYAAPGRLRSTTSATPGTQRPGVGT